MDPAAHNVVIAKHCESLTVRNMAKSSPSKASKSAKKPAAVAKVSVAKPIKGKKR